MSCLKLGQNSFLSSSSSKQKARNAESHAYQPKYFMDGNPTSLSTFELGCDSDSSANSVWNDENSLYGNESILASSHQNSTTNFPTSAPSSIVRDKILACSTPKDQLTENSVKPKMEATSPAPIQPAPTSYAATPFMKGTPWEDRRLNYRNNRMRNMARPSPVKPGCENIMNSYFTRENRPLLEEIHRRNEQQEQNRLRRQQAESREHLLNTLKEHIVELVCSVLVLMWQFFFALNTIPTEEPLVQIFNLIICFVYGAVFLATQPTWWGIVGCSFGVYYGITWLFGCSLAYGSFAFAAVFARAAVTVFQVIVSLTC